MQCEYVNACYIKAFVFKREIHRRLKTLTSAFFLLAEFQRGTILPCFDTAEVPT